MPRLDSLQRNVWVLDGDVSPNRMVFFFEENSVVDESQHGLAFRKKKKKTDPKLLL